LFRCDALPGLNRGYIRSDRSTIRHIPDHLAAAGYEITVA